MFGEVTVKKAPGPRESWDPDHERSEDGEMIAYVQNPKKNFCQ